MDLERRINSGTELVCESRWQSMLCALARSKSALEAGVVVRVPKSGQFTLFWPQRNRTGTDPWCVG